MKKSAAYTWTFTVVRMKKNYHFATKAGLQAIPGDGEQWCNVEMLVAEQKEF